MNDPTCTCVRPLGRIKRIRKAVFDKILRLILLKNTVMECSSIHPSNQFTIKKWGKIIIKAHFIFCINVVPVTIADHYQKYSGLTDKKTK